MRIAVTGATGIVGRFVVARLHAKGATVRALVRSSSARAGLPPETRFVVGDLTDDGVLGELVEDVDAVVHCAYAHAPGRYRGGEGDDRFAFWRTNLLAGVGLMERARLAGVRRLVLLSSRAVFGRNTVAADWVDDDTRPVPDTHYGALKLALEAHVSAFSSADDVCYTSLRPTGVYGVTHPVENSKWFDLARAVASGAALPPARLGTEVHGIDVANAVWILLTSPPKAVAGRAFNCADLMVDTREVMAKLAQELDLPAQLPEAARNRVRHPMRTTALQALGWRPGGEERLARTISELAGSVRGT
ncbi:MAG: NAD(P)-dependent oxidoreductase [Gammaproteobacteria bacterium]|nr:NAD(P)-dependent oxidoreductase [Gammaproteobacteria bacterium]